MHVFIEAFFSTNLMSFVLFNTPTSTHISVRVSSAVCSSAKRKYIEEIFSSDSKDMASEAAKLLFLAEE